MIPFLEKPRVNIEIRRAVAGDLKDIMEIEEASFTTPWPSDVMINEITANPFSEVMVALHEKKVVSFMICWVVNCERHLQNIATAPAWRSRGVARMLMDHLIQVHPVLFIVAKLALVMLGCMLLWRLRTRALAVVSIFLVFFVYYAVLLYHLQFMDLHLVERWKTAWGI